MLCIIIIIIIIIIIHNIIIYPKWNPKFGAHSYSLMLRFFWQFSISVQIKPVIVDI